MCTACAILRLTRPDPFRPAPTRPAPPRPVPEPRPAQVGLLRKNLLRLLRVREFSAEAEFVDPCRSYTLRDVVRRAAPSPLLLPKS